MNLYQRMKQDFAEKIDLRLLIVVSFACLLIVSYRYYIEYPILSKGYIDHLFGSVTTAKRSLLRYISWHILSFIIMIILPLIVMMVINAFSRHKLSPARYTFAVGDYKTGLKLALLFVTVFVSILLLFAIFQPSHFNPYPLCKSPLILSNMGVFILFEFTQCLYMISFEYFFRGFVLFEAQRLFGYNAIAFTLLPYIIVKIGKGPVEIYTAVLVGIFLAYTAVKAKSFIYPALAHASIAVANDVITLVIKTNQ